MRRALLAAGRPEPAAPIVEAATLDDFTGHYLRAMAPRQAPATIRTTADAYRLRVSPALGGLTLDELTRERLEVWLAGLLEAGASRDAAQGGQGAAGDPVGRCGMGSHRVEPGIALAAPAP